MGAMTPFNLEVYRALFLALDARRSRVSRVGFRGGSRRGGPMDALDHSSKRPKSLAKNCDPIGSLFNVNGEILVEVVAKAA